MPTFLKINFQVNLLLLLMLLSFGVVQAQVPDAPTNLVVTPLNTGGMIQFTAPASDGGSAITNYEYSTDNGDTWITPSPAITSSPLIISSGLTNCTSYQVKIRAVNAEGSGAASLAATLVPSASTIGVSISSTATSDTICAGTSVTFTATPTNGGISPVYQWKKK